MILVPIVSKNMKNGSYVSKQPVNSYFGICGANKDSPINMLVHINSHISPKHQLTWHHIIFFIKKIVLLRSIWSTILSSSLWLSWSMFLGRKLKLAQQIELSPRFDSICCWNRRFLLLYLISNHRSLNFKASSFFLLGCSAEVWNFLKFFVQIGEGGPLCLVKSFIER